MVLEKQAGCQNNDARQPDKGPRQAAERPYISPPAVPAYHRNNVDSQVFDSIFPFLPDPFCQGIRSFCVRSCAVFSICSSSPFFASKLGIENLLSLPGSISGFPGRCPAPQTAHRIYSRQIRYPQYAQRPLARVGIIHPADIHISPAPG